MGTRAQTSLAPYRHDPRTRLIELLKRWLRGNAANAAISEEEAIIRQVRYKIQDIRYSSSSSSSRSRSRSRSRRSSSSSSSGSSSSSSSDVT